MSILIEKKIEEGGPLGQPQRPPSWIPHFEFRKAKAKFRISDLIYKISDLIDLNRIKIVLGRCRSIVLRFPCFSRHI